MARIRIGLDLDEDARPLVVDALRTDSRRRQRAATKAAAELHAERASGEKRDIRSGAVMVSAMLVDAARLDEAADAIEAATPVARIPDASPAPAKTVAAGAADTAPAAPAPDPDASPDVRTPAEAIAETAKVIAALGMNRDAGDEALDFDELDEADDGSLPEDRVTDLDDEAAAALPDLTPAP